VSAHDARRKRLESAQPDEVSVIANAAKANLQDIQPFRALFLQETNMQIRYDACHARGWTDPYLLNVDDVAVGYASIKGQQIADRDTVFEFYVTPAYRKWARQIFAELLAAAGSTYIECQSNDALLSAMLYEFARDIDADTVLFEDFAVTEHRLADAVVRRRRDEDRVFPHGGEPAGDYVLDAQGEIVATAGFMLHYNPPFADLYMEVREDRRRRGFGSFILQEVKKACYLAGRVPAARCHVQNSASRATLIKAGLRVCGFMLKGEVWR
jgi:GNAT superfamily N-acetyltransferase